MKRFANSLLGLSLLISGFLLSYALENLRQEISAFLIISGILVFIRQLVDTVSLNLSGQINDIDTAIGSLSKGLEFSKTGITNLYESRNQAISRVPKLLIQTNNRFDLAGIMLSSLLRSQDFEDEVLRAADRGVRIRVLLLDPKSVYLELQTKIEGIDSQSFRGRLEFSISKWQKLQKKAGKQNFDLKLFDFPQFSFLLLSDTKVVLTLNAFHGKTSRQPTLEIGTEGGNFYKTLLRHYEWMWMRSKI